MSIPVFGFFVIALGIWCQFGPYQRTLIAMFSLTTLSGMSALDLPSLGGASITPANFFIIFYLLRILGLRDGRAALGAELGPNRPLLPFLLLIIWILGSAILLPRLFNGATYVFSLERSVTNDSASLLHPTSGNISQSVYALGGFAVACITSAFVRRPGGAEVALKAIVTITMIDVGFAILDMITNATHTGFILDLVHTANYSFLANDDVAGVKRLTGSFSEASAFAYYSLCLLAMNLSLYVMNVRPRFTGPVSILLTLFVILSTSSAGYAGLLALYVGFFGYAVYSALVRSKQRPIAIALVGGAGAFLIIAAVMLLLPSVTTVAWNVIDESLIHKAASASAYERGTWNEMAIKVFWDTYGLGAGIGSTRVSNYALVLLSNLGIIGFVLFVILLLKLVFGRLADRSDALGSQITWGARNAILTSLVPALLVGTVYDLGSIFYVLIGLASSGIAAQERRSGWPAQAGLAQRG